MLIYKRLVKGKSLNSTVAVNCAVKKEYTSFLTYQLTFHPRTDMSFPFHQGAAANIDSVDVHVTVVNNASTAHVP